MSTIVVREQDPSPQGSTGCRLCGSDTVEMFSTRDYRRPADRTEYEVRWCCACEFGRINASFTPDDVSRFFDIPYYTHGAEMMGAAKRLADQENRAALFDRAIAHLAWRTDRSAHFTPAELGPANGRTFCDIGCGDGRNLERSRDLGFRVTGVEPDPIARERAKRYAEVFDGTAEVLPREIASRHFDVILLLHVLDVCIDIRTALNNIRAIVSPGGTVIIETPNCAAKGFQLYGPEWPWTDVPRNQNFFTKQSLGTALVQSGFAVKQVFYLGYTRQFSPYWKATQAEIHAEIGNSRSRRRRSSLEWLIETAFAAPDRKYDSIRFLARPI